MAFYDSGRERLIKALAVNAWTWLPSRTDRKRSGVRIVWPVSIRAHGDYPQLLDWVFLRRPLADMLVGCSGKRCVPLVAWGLAGPSGRTAHPARPAGFARALAGRAPSWAEWGRLPGWWLSPPAGEAAPRQAMPGWFRTRPSTPGQPACRMRRSTCAPLERPTRPLCPPSRARPTLPTTPFRRSRRMQQPPLTAAGSRLPARAFAMR